ncbi:DUF1735 domain-containing protein [Haoranjiania flava]|uniref:DUF1735 domain-containing protein n=1 Tax=Haoranjiania flava TaxID=1856322 RepID=A0AAE3IK35_9BACT|nr:DUF1735 domain-containing protein [Haoranjiania flava]MCU7693592.1 DUF1735 domain-containing protein [Haoranjiania flava]
MRSLFKIFILLICSFNISSCLKDDSQIIKPEEVKSVVEFGNPSSLESGLKNPIRFYIQSFDIAPLDTIIIPVNYAGHNNAPKDIKVTIKVDNNVIDSFNVAEHYDFYPLNPAIYQMSETVTIKSGEQTGYLQIPVKIDQIDFTHDYAIGLKITDASGEIISKNFSKMVINVGPKNKYDGRYTYRTSANTSLVPNANKTVELHTAGPNRLKLIPGLLGTYSNEVYYNIDPATNQITVECPSLGVQTPQDLRSKYDPATKTLKVFWKQGNGGRTFEETFIYLGAR